MRGGVNSAAEQMTDTVHRDIFGSRGKDTASYYILIAI